MRSRHGKPVSFIVTLILLCSWYIAIGDRPASAGKMPVITIDSYELTKGDFSPGSKNTITLTIKNNGTKYTADSVTVTYTSLENVNPAFGVGNQVVINSLAAGASTKVSFDVCVPTAIEAEYATLSFNMAYVVFGEGEDYKDFSNAVNIALPVQYDQTFSVNSVSVADTTSVGATTLVSISYSNGGTKDVTNVVLNIEGNIESDNKKVIIGDLSGGQTEYKDTYVKFLESGTQNLSMTISYIDADGRSITKDIGTSTVDVAPSKSKDTGNQVTVEKNSSSTYMKIAIIAIVILLAAACAVTFAMKRKD